MCDLFKKTCGADNGCAKHVHIVVAVFLLMGILFLGAATLRQYKEYKYVGAGLEATNTIAVTGEAEIMAVPDVATFTVTVREEKKTTEEAQAAATNKMNDIISFLKENGVSEKDIKTQNYNINPRYEWIKNCALFDAIGECDRERTLMGYVVSQSLRVKVRDTDTAGEILAGVGARAVDTVSGLSFEVDDDDALRAQARREAIKDAQTKASVLAKDLGVELVRVASFSEGGNKVLPVTYGRMDMALMKGVGGGAPAPELPMGENAIISTVTITYEIR